MNAVAADDEELPVLSREDVRRIEVAAMFAELNPAAALEDACLQRHQQRLADQREHYRFKKNGEVREYRGGGGAPERLVTIDGETRKLSEWARHFNIGRSTVQQRIEQGGMTPEQALKTPPRTYTRRGFDVRMVTIDGETRTFAAWTRHFGIHHATARARVERGMSLLDALTMPVDAKHSPNRRREQHAPALRMLRQPTEAPMKTRTDTHASAQPPTAPSGGDLASAFERAQQRARAKAQAQAALASLTPDDQRNVLADLLVALEAP